MPDATPSPLAPPLGPTRAPRLVSLDAFRGLVIAAMLLVNNVETADAPHFLKHADWIADSQADAWRGWWAGVRATGLTPGSLAGLPLLTHCTLADYVMPCFLLIIGVAIPFGAASQRRRGVSALQVAGRTVARAATLVALGWAIAASLAFYYWYHSPDPARPLRFTLGMDVLQLLGVSYLVARAAYALPTVPRLAVAGAMFVGHWALLRFYPQPGVAAGTFTEAHNAASVVYATWGVFAAMPLGPAWLVGSLGGMLSVVPAGATMIAGTWLGDVLRDGSLPDRSKVRRLLFAGIGSAVLGFLWAFDLPFNKPRWTPAYLLWAGGVGTIILTAFWWVADVRGVRRWTLPLVVLGVNSIAVYFASIVCKVWLLNVPKVPDGSGGSQSLKSAILAGLTSAFGPAGPWVFTLAFVAVWWAAMAVLYRKRVFIRV